jgi:hypothetical protein
MKHADVCGKIGVRTVRKGRRDPAHRRWIMKQRRDLMVVIILLCGSACVDSATTDVDEACEDGTIAENQLCLNGTWHSRNDCEPRVIDGDDPGRVCVESTDCFGGSSCGRDDETIGCCKHDGPTDVRFRNATGFEMGDLFVSWGGIEFEVPLLKVDGASEFARYPRITVIEMPDVHAVVDGDYLEYNSLNDIGTDYYLGRGKFEVALSVWESSPGVRRISVGAREPLDP